VARKNKQPKKTHVSIRRRGPGYIRDHVPVVQRAPLRASSYSVGERCTLVELMVFFLVDREIVNERDISRLVTCTLEVQKCAALLKMGADKPRFGRAAPGLQVVDMFRRLVELQLLKPADARDPNSPSVITPKGLRHIKKQPKKLQLAAQKLVFTDLLDKLARVVL